MLRAKKKTHVKSRAITDSTLLQEDATGENQTTTRNQLEETDYYLEKLQAMTELQRAILVKLIPLSPRAMHSEILRKAVAPFLTARDKKGRRREFEAAVAPLVHDGLVRYFCCIVDSYAMNPLHVSIAPYLTGREAKYAPQP